MADERNVEQPVDCTDPHYTTSQARRQGRPAVTLVQNLKLNPTGINTASPKTSDRLQRPTDSLDQEYEEQYL